jgi:hypothetical protein
MAAGGRSMDESIAVDGNPDVQFLARQMHEYEVAGLEFAPGDRRPCTQLLLCGSWQLNPRPAGRVYDETAAVEAAGCGAAVPVRLAEHGRGAVDYQSSSI